jgi:hypothetical protein
MRLIVALLLTLHGIAHFVGFRASFWPGPTRPTRLVRLPRQVEGAGWLLIGLSFIAVAALLLTQHASWSLLLISTAAASLLLCVVAWPDARIGLVIDVVLLVLALLLSPRNTDSHLMAAFGREVNQAGLRLPVRTSEVVEERSIADLPAPVQRYLRFMGVVGRPRDTSVRASFSGRFRRDQGEWLSCEVLQHDASSPIGRVFMMQLSLKQLLPVTVRDKYVGGHGSLEAKVFDVFSVAQGSGYELDVGELVTYLNDAILMAPSFLLGPQTTWSQVDADTFDVALRDGATAVKARVWRDARGAPIT